MEKDALDMLRPIGKKDGSYSCHVDWRPSRCMGRQNRYSFYRPWTQSLLHFKR